MNIGRVFLFIGKRIGIYRRADGALTTSNTKEIVRNQLMNNT
jgi:hypothetical protein